MAGIKSGGGKSLQKIIDRHQGHPGAMLGILEDVQASDPHRYLSDEALRAVADATGTPLASVYSTATFYSYFNLKPQGDHVIVVCRGTALHVKAPFTPKTANFPSGSLTRTKRSASCMQIFSESP